MVGNVAKRDSVKRAIFESVEQLSGPGFRATQRVE